MSYSGAVVTNPDRSNDAPLTLTHARLRAAQGDVEAARRILLALLASEPGNDEASGLLRALGGDEPLVPGGERVDRRDALRGWREAIRRKRGPRRDAR